MANSCAVEKGHADLYLTSYNPHIITTVVAISNLQKKSYFDQLKPHELPSCLGPLHLNKAHTAHKIIFKAHCIFAIKMDELLLSRRGKGRLKGFHFSLLMEVRP